MNPGQNAITAAPICTRLLLIAWCAQVALVSLIGPALDGWLTQTFALIPARLSAAIFGGGSPSALLTLLSSTFIHAGWFHCLANAMFLLIVGPPLERGLGARLFLIIFALTSIAAGLAQWLSDPGSFLGVVGASGGLSGLFGTYAVLFTRANLPDRSIGGIRLSGSLLHMLWQLAAWIGLQLLLALVFNQGGGGVAIWAHIGGFIAGMAAGVLLRLHVIKQQHRG